MEVADLFERDVIPGEIARQVGEYAPSWSLMSMMCHSYPIALGSGQNWPELTSRTNTAI